MAKNNIEEEVTITPIIKDIERIANQIIRSISAAIIFIYQIIIKFILYCLKNLIFLSIFIAFGALIGYFSNKVVEPKYSSDLILDLQIEAKSQLEADINFIRSVIENEEKEILATTLGITKKEACTIKDIRLVGSSTYIDKLKNLNTFYKELDTTLLNKIEIETFLSNDINDFDERYSIVIESTDKAIFSKLEPHLLKFLERVPELQKLKENTKSNLIYQRQIYLAEMQHIDTLKKVMNNVMIEQAKSNSNGSVTNISFDQKEQKKNFDILEIYNRYLSYSREVVLLKEQIDDLEYCYKVNTHFSSVGSKSSFKNTESILVFALIFFALGVLLLLIKDTRNNHTTLNG